MTCSPAQESRHYADWLREDCGSRTCAAGAGRVVCSLLPDRDPACATVTDFRRICVGAQVIECAIGYRVGEQTCKSADLCVEGDVAPVGAMCVLSRTPDPACSPEGPSTQSVCVGQLSVDCEGPFRVGETDCGGPGQCRIQPEGSDEIPGPVRPTAVCVLSAVPDARCSDPTKVLGTSGHSRAGCSDNTLFSCLDDWLTSEMPCGALVCAKDPGGNGAAPSAFPDCRAP